MLQKHSISDATIINCLSTHYGIEVTTLTLLPIGADQNASLYKAGTYFIKLKAGHHHDIGIELVELFHSAGIKQIIPPVKTIQGKPTQSIKDFTLIVYPFVEGENGFKRKLTDDQWIELGRALRQVHELEVPLSIQNRIRKESYSAKWRDFVRSLPETKPVIQKLVNRAEQFAEELKKKSLKFVLCHSDIHAGNVLLGDQLYIVDWDDPIMAPKERDLMFIGGGVGNVWNRPEEEVLFYKGYGKVEVDRVALAYYRNERIVEDVAEYAEESFISEHFDAMFQPNGVVDIALYRK